MRKKHSVTIQSPVIRRLLMFWLPALLLILGMVYVSKMRYNPDKEAKSGLQRLNKWRVQAGVPPLNVLPALQKAARNHALYLTKDAHGHDERNTSNPYYTGETPQARATAAGYAASISENLTLGKFVRSGSNSVDSLMTALYHRLSLLNPETDEAGAAWARGKYYALVLEQGSSQEREWCDNAPYNMDNARIILTLQCQEKPLQIPLASKPKRFVGIVKFPIGTNIEPVYNGKEQPNPMPNMDETGNPISIAFYGQTGDIRLHSFQLFAPTGEVHDTIILTSDNDPNHLLDKTQFALFSKKPLAFNTEYRVEFHYSLHGQKKTERWAFRTRAKRHWFE